MSSQVDPESDTSGLTFKIPEVYPLCTNFRTRQDSPTYAVYGTDTVAEVQKATRGMIITVLVAWCLLRDFCFSVKRFAAVWYEVSQVGLDRFPYVMITGVLSEGSTRVQWMKLPEIDPKTTFSLNVGNDTPRVLRHTVSLLSLAR